VCFVAFQTFLTTLSIVLLMPRPPPISTLFPYTTLFRSSVCWPRTGMWHTRGTAIRHPWARTNSRSPAGRSNGRCGPTMRATPGRSEEHTSELQSRFDLVCRLLLEKKKKREKTTACEIEH